MEGMGPYASRVTVMKPGFVINVGPKRPSVGRVCVGGGGYPPPHGREIF